MTSTRTLVIPRQRNLPPQTGDRTQTGVPAPYLGKSEFRMPGGWLRGEDPTRHRLCELRPDRCKGRAQFQTEDLRQRAAPARPGSDAGNAQGDRPSSAQSRAQWSADLTVDGRAELRAYTHGATAESSAKPPDVHGPDASTNAPTAALQLQGSSFVGERLRSSSKSRAPPSQLKGGSGRAGGRVWHLTTVA